MRDLLWIHNKQLSFHLNITTSNQLFYYKNITGESSSQGSKWKKSFT